MVTVRVDRRRFNTVGVLALALAAHITAGPSVAFGQAKAGKQSAAAKEPAAQEPGSENPAAGTASAGQEPGADTGSAAAAGEMNERFKSIQWQVGPGTGDVGGIAKLKIPAGYRFTGADGAATWAELNRNPSGGQLGMVTPPFDPAKGEFPAWYVVFRFEDVGYVKDDEKDKLTDETADALLKSIREGTERANAERRGRGWPTISLDGWNQKPFYDEQTKALTWAITGSSEGEKFVNYDSRVLGRRGVMNVKLVLDEGQVAATVPTFRTVIKGLTFNPGQSHAEFKSGDKIAEYGLIGLVGGGAAVAVVKWWKPLMKFGIFIVAGIALAAKKVFSMFRRNPAGA